MREFSKLNKSAMFIYPLLGLDKRSDEYLYDTYLYHEEYRELVDHFYLLFKFDGKVANSGKLFSSVLENPYLDIEERVLKDENYFAHYDVKDGEYVLFIMQIPDNFLEDYNKFLLGKYSEFSPKAKGLVNSRYGLVHTRNIFNKDEAWRKSFSSLMGMDIPKDQEYWGLFNEDHETFSESKLLINATQA